MRMVCAAPEIWYLAATVEEKDMDPFDCLGDVLPGLEALYKDIHSHPELSMQETRTAGLAAERLRAMGFEVTTGVGKTGVVGVLRNGEGRAVMMRADMDALPVEEATGLPYASKVKSKDGEGNTVPVMHACGHDMHVAPRPPEIKPLDRYALTSNDPVASERILQAFRDHFSEKRVRQTNPSSASEDFGCYGSQWHVPSVFWFVGGTDPRVYAEAKEAGRIHDIPTNHNPRFAPVLHPTLEAGVEAMVIAARAWLAAPRA